MIFNNILTESIKSIILRLGLYDTGALYDSILVFTTTNNNIIEIDLHAMYYLIYLWEPYNIESEIINDINVSNEINSLMSDYISNGVKIIMEGGDFELEDIKILINIIEID